MTLKPNAAVVRGAYAVGVLLMVVPLTEITLRVWPLRLADTAWRFGAFGLLASATITPLLGVLVAGMLAFALGHRGVIRVLSACCILAAVAMLLGLGVFLLDAVEMRGRAVAAARLAFDVTVVQSMLKVGIVMLVAAVLGVGGWRSTRLRAGRARESAESLVRPRSRAESVAAAPAAANGAES